MHKPDIFNRVFLYFDLNVDMDIGQARRLSGIEYSLIIRFYNAGSLQFVQVMDISTSFIPLRNTAEKFMQKWFSVVLSSRPLLIVKAVPLCIHSMHALNDPRPGYMFD